MKWNRGILGVVVALLAVACPLHSGAQKPRREFSADEAYVTSEIYNEYGFLYEVALAQDNRRQLKRLQENANLASRPSQLVYYTAMYELTHDAQMIPRLLDLMPDSFSEEMIIAGLPSSLGRDPKQRAMVQRMAGLGTAYEIYMSKWIPQYPSYLQKYAWLSYYWSGRVAQGDLEAQEKVDGTLAKHFGALFESAKKSVKAYHDAEWAYFKRLRDASSSTQFCGGDNAGHQKEAVSIRTNQFLYENPRLTIAGIALAKNAGELKALDSDLANFPLEAQRLYYMALYSYKSGSSSKSKLLALIPQGRLGSDCFRFLAEPHVFFMTREERDGGCPRLAELYYGYYALLGQLVAQEKGALPRYIGARYWALTYTDGRLKQILDDNDALLEKVYGKTYRDQIAHVGALIKSNIANP